MKSYKLDCIEIDRLICVHAMTFSFVYLETFAAMQCILNLTRNKKEEI
jgi:hypothetical protein